MSDTASLELSRKLFELSGWDNTPAGGKERWVELPDNSWDCLRLSDVEANGLDRQLWFNGIPSFSAGYLLRKLPPEINISGHWESFTLDVYGGRWSVRYGLKAPAQMEVKADTPEDALCSLLIKLIKAGILPISGRD